jgi:hypothetical protein
MNLIKTLFSIGLVVIMICGCASTPDSSATAQDTSSAELPMYSDTAFLELVRKYAANDGESVDYAAWKDSPEDMQALAQHIQLIALVSPENQPEQFPGKAAVKGYWINAYNALVLDGVLELWPLESVRDVKVTFTSKLVPGKGFFYDQPVTVGGRQSNLFDLEKEVLASQRDPRLHFALNCGSESCPVLRPWEWNDAQLDEAAREFVNRPENVAVADKKLWVSRIFKWYKKDFPKDLNGYLQQYAGPDLQKQLQLAKNGGYPTRYRKYDWSVNTQTPAESADGDSP